MLAEVEQRRLPRLARWGILLAASALYCWPLLTRENLPWGMDMSFAVQMTQGMLHGLQDGHLYPRWVDAMSRGFGAPAFIFYPPLTYYASASLALLTGDLALGIRLTVIVGCLLSAVSFYYLARSFASELGALLGAVLYVLLPYHALDLYDRFAFAELTSFVFLPLPFLFVRRLAQEPQLAPALGLALSYAALVMTHLITGYIVLFALAPYALTCLGRGRPWGKLGFMLGAGVVALALCAIFLVPMLVERSEVHLQYIVESFFGDWRRNFAFRDETRFGFRPDPIKTSVNICVATQAWLTAIAALLVWLRCDPEGRRQGLGLAAIGALVTLLQLPVSAPLWRWIPELANVQFPWRFGALQGLFAAATVACVLRPAREGAPRLATSTWLALVLVLACAPALYASTRDVELRMYVYDPALVLKPGIQGKVLLEYTPRQATLWRRMPELPVSPRRHAELRGRGRVDVLHWTSHARELRVEPEQADELIVFTFAHPGWTATIDGRSLEVGIESGFGAILLRVPAGVHVVRLEFGWTPSRLLGATLSALAAFGALVVAVRLLGRRRTPERL
jgi:hypothetical protein